MCIVNLSILIFLFWIQISSACQEGKFGDDCMYTCHCHGDTRCDITSGACLLGCALDWSGPSCQRENVAFGRPTRQKEGQSEASLAVDGDPGTCSSTREDVPGWWSVTLDSAVNVSRVAIVTERTGSILDWKVYVGPEGSILSMSLCATAHVHTSGATLPCDVPTRGNHVMVVNRAGPVVICDIKIIHCSPSWYGEDCSHTCNCKDLTEVCDTVTGACASGCSPGWLGDDCKKACKNGTYGAGCSYQCGKCKDDTPCDHVTGTCLNGCERGWTGIFCREQCSKDTFGEDCVTSCGRCYGVGACDIITGNCMHGCETGFTGPKCLLECPSGTFGRGCSGTCGQCAGGEPCDVTIGICVQGCDPGWTVCPRGQFGPRCSRECHQCKEGRCNGTSGRCLLGCAYGFRGVDCAETCPLTTYGVNCSSQCGNCHQDGKRQCDVTSGICPHGCQPGYKGDWCTEACEPGFYGDGCNQCGMCDGAVCDAISGECPSGCKEGYQGLMCFDGVPFSDEDGPQLKVFLGIMLTLVGSIMALVTFCLVLIWRREHLPDMPSSCDVSQHNDEEDRIHPKMNGCVPVDIEETTELI
ncbi:multiple epidermal growth factor-like domains protein 6 isoform X2 [Mya arenaria]|uniref:multiple epidermal growth factor-like domains protein 6 isoform X2 n=1 Tax=Mya arenaria TaxID=6604 RepID=UPI0022E7E039|nr:multiple epidermal growth factor-like domains protein 6 isoform X2 [Mya arenaria]